MEQHPTPLRRQLSSHSEQILDSLSGSLGGNSKALLSEALLAIKTAREDGEISDDDKTALKRQLVAGKGYDEDLLGKLSPVRQLTLMKEMNKRVVLKEEKAGEKLECPICTERYCRDNPSLVAHMLPCGHSLCLRCLSDLVKQDPARRLCPLDRKPLPSDLSMFPVNYSLLDFLSATDDPLPMPPPVRSAPALPPTPLPTASRAPERPREVPDPVATLGDELLAMTLQNQFLNEEPLQAAQSSGSPLSVGNRVVLSSDYEQYTDASSGPMRPGDVGTVVEVGQAVRGCATYQVEFNNRRWWYQPCAVSLSGGAPAVSSMSRHHAHPLAPCTQRRR